jgi:hypothetical protein
MTNINRKRCASVVTTGTAKQVTTEETMSTPILAKSCFQSLSARQAYNEANRALRLSLQLLRPKDKPFGIRHKLLYCNLFNRSRGRWRLTIRSMVWDAAQLDADQYHYSQTHQVWVYMPSIETWRRTGAWSSRCEPLPKQVRNEG